MGKRSSAIRHMKPVLELAGLARKVAGGRFDERAQVRSDDEPGELARAFNGMIEARSDDGYSQQVESYLPRHTGASFSHGICPDCLAEARADLGRDVRPEGPGSCRP